MVSVQLLVKMHNFLKDQADTCTVVEGVYGVTVAVVPSLTKISILQIKFILYT